MGSGDPEKNTTPPAGELEGSGWDLHGGFGNFTGIPIGPHHFVAAKHIGQASAFLEFRGTNYTIVSSASDSDSDLVLYEVRDTFPEFAQLFDGASELGAAVMVFGRGAQRGAEVFLGDELRGWKWGAWDMRMRWGTNVVADIMVNNPEAPGTELLQVDFDQAGGADEAHLAVGDSSGGVFLRQNGQWRLAGLNFSVDGPYNTSTNGTGFLAALFKHDGFYFGGEGNWKLITRRTPIGSFYATRIKARRDWIDGVLALPTTPSLFASETVDGSYTLVTDVVIQASSNLMRVSIGEGMRFFRLQSSIVREIISVTVENGVTLRLEYR